MPTILRIGSFRFHFYSNEGTEPAHVRSPAGECKFWLDPVRLASNNGIAASDLREVEKHVSEHRAMLMEKYHEFHGR